MRGSVSGAVDAMAERFNKRCGAACLQWLPVSPRRPTGRMRLYASP